jgi:hypothetical protein
MIGSMSTVVLSDGFCMNLIPALSWQDQLKAHS